MKRGGRSASGFHLSSAVNYYLRLALKSKLNETTQAESVDPPCAAPYGQLSLLCEAIFLTANYIEIVGSQMRFGYKFDLFMSAKVEMIASVFHCRRAQ